jgi:hypothetical protein
MAGVEQEILVFAPTLQGQSVILGVNNAASSATLQTTIGTNGFGSASWTPNAGGTWTVSGLGTAVYIGATSITVAAAPTNTVLLSGNFIQ